MTRILAIDTSGPQGAVAAWQGDALCAVEELQSGFGHAAALHPAIDRLLSAVGWDTSDLQAIGVCHGPGAFTGVRVGLATAKALALALNIPLYAVSSLAALAQPRREEDTAIAAVIDAKQAEVYAAVYQGHDCLCEEFVAAPAEAAQRIAACAAECLVVGSGAERYPDEFRHNMQPVQREAHPVVMVAQLAAQAAGEKKPSMHEVLPNYIRASYAKRRGEAS